MKYQALYDLVKEPNSAAVIATEDGKQKFIGFAVPGHLTWVIRTDEDPRIIADQFDEGAAVALDKNPQYIMASRGVEDIIITPAQVFSDRQYAAGYADGSDIGWYYDMYAARIIQLRRARI